MKPLISVIVPVYKVELYLRNCIDSILCQTYQNLEIILVDDGSPDQCGAICDEYAAEDSRIKVIHKKNGGLSDARNAGIDIAQGEYIGFVDSDDWIAPDMYEYLWNGIEAYDADIALCEYYLCEKNNYKAANRPEVRVFKGKEAMDGLLELQFGNYAWNKLYKRSLWEDEIRYPVGRLYEDVLTTYRLVEKCNTVVALTDAKYYYRQTAESISGKRAVRNDAQCVISRIDVFERIADRYPQHNPFLLKIIYEHSCVLRETISKKGKKEYDAYQADLERISSFLRRHQRVIFEHYEFGNTEEQACTLMAKGTFDGWKDAEELVLRKKEEQKKSEKKAKRRIRKRISHIRETRQNAAPLTYYYNKCLCMPIEERSVFIESRGGDDLAGNMFFIAQEACRRGIKAYICVRDSSREKVLSILETGDFKGAVPVIKPSEEYYRAVAVSKYWFCDMVLEDHFIKRPEQIYVNTWHGTPLKMLELDVKTQRNEIGGAARDFIKCDYIAVPGDYLFRKLLESNHLDTMFSGKELCAGYPRNSVFFNPENGKIVRQHLNADEKEIFIYMPTWRGTWTSHTGNSGSYSTKKIMDFFEENLEENQIILVKLHNFAVDTIDFSAYRKVLPFPAEFDTYTVLTAADCLITDYSSVFFDFANARKKIILFTYDKEEYISDRGLYLDMDQLPFPQVRNYQELKEELNTDVRYDDSAFIQEYCGYDCADSAEKILDFVIDGKPVCATRNWKKSEKKNILVYDSAYVYRSEFPEGLNSLLEKFDTENANYYYCYRQWLLKKNPGFLRNMPEDIRLYSIPMEPFFTIKERMYRRRRKTEPDSVVKREMKRVFNGYSFDEMYVVDENKWDPYYRVFRHAFQTMGEK